MVAQDEIHFQLGGGSPVSHGAIQPLVPAVGPYLAVEEMLEGVSEDLASRHDFPALQQVVGHAHIEQVKLGRLDHAPFGFLPVAGQEPGEEGVLQDLEIFLDRGPADAAIRGDILVVDDASVAESRRFQETREYRDVARQGFGGNLFLQVIPQVGFQEPSGVLRQVMARRSPWFKALRRSNLGISALTRG